MLRGEYWLAATAPGWQSPPPRSPSWRDDVFWRLSSGGFAMPPEVGARCDGGPGAPGGPGGFVVPRVLPLRSSSFSFSSLCSFRCSFIATRRLLRPPSPSEPPRPPADLLLLPRLPPVAVEVPEIRPTPCRPPVAPLGTPRRPLATPRWSALPALASIGPGLRFARPGYQCPPRPPLSPAVVPGLRFARPDTLRPPRPPGLRFARPESLPVVCQALALRVLTPFPLRLVFVVLASPQAFALRVLRPPSLPLDILSSSTASGLRFARPDSSCTSTAVLSLGVSNPAWPCHRPDSSSL